MTISRQLYKITRHCIGHIHPWSLTEDNTGILHTLKLINGAKRNTIHHVIRGSRKSSIITLYCMPLISITMEGKILYQPSDTKSESVGLTILTIPLSLDWGNVSWSYPILTLPLSKGYILQHNNMLPEICISSPQEIIDPLACYSGRTTKLS